ncbi:MAG TPA: GntG family PLP-dependent aldolase [Gaiellaceae bacterium]|nr:GntG family PLP-dependent aldolase [Gaiellaceae bacterium]
MIDLHSDTLTKPTPAMLAAMAAAEVGDEQYREDPTVNELQRRAAELLGHEAALFLPTATMANQVALRAQTTPGSTLLAEERTHVMVYEAGGPAIHSGLVMRSLPGEEGRLSVEQIEAEPELGPGGIVVLENTHRSSGGRIWPVEAFRAAVEAAHARGARVHLDGARLFNASVAAGEPPSAWSAHADTVTICFSKGLGCPLGAVLASSAETIERAWEGKFLLGGALRQAGVVAAAALHALDHHVERLAEDHARARLLDGDAETNFAVIEDRPGLQASLRERGLLVGNLRPGWLRAVTYLGVDDADVEAAAGILAELHVAA